MPLTVGSIRQAVGWLREAGRTPLAGRCSNGPWRRGARPQSTIVLKLVRYRLIGAIVISIPLGTSCV